MLSDKIDKLVKSAKVRHYGERHIETFYNSIKIEGVGKAGSVVPFGFAHFSGLTNQP
jgi:hypothetical protein